MAAPPSEFRLALSASRHTGARARNAIRNRFGGLLSPHKLSDLLLVVTELVNNSVKHGPGTPITVTLVPGEDSIRGEIVDQGNPALELPPLRDVERELGLSVVDGLTASWAVDDGSTNVSFELSLDEN